MARAGADHEGTRALGDVGARIVQRIVGQRQVPGKHAIVHAAGVGEAEEAVEHMLALPRCDLRIGEKPLQFTGASPVEPQLAPRRHHCGHGAGAQRELQVQQEVEAAIGEAQAQRAQSSKPGTLVDGDKLDLGQQGQHQACLGPADEPGETGLRPRALQRA